MKFIESICFKNGSYQNLALHQLRVDKTFAHFFKGSSPIELNSILPEVTFPETYKVRVIYDEESQDVEFINYQKRVIETLMVVQSEPFDYSFKYENRDRINQLKAASKADDTIISFDGEIKDSSYANLAFWDGRNWLTPEKPLLKGVKRSQLLKEDKIKESPIEISDLQKFEKVSLINAMLDLGEMEIDMKEILISKTAY